MISAHPPIDAFFVYGTLCRGRCREACWPRRPLRITSAWAIGGLFDRHDYPAMRAGDDRVIGECWQFRSEDMDEVTRVIDEVEGTHQPGLPNLYDRVVVDVFELPRGFQSAPDISMEPAQWNACSRIARCYGYHYSSDPITHGFTRIVAQNHAPVRWPISS